MRRTLPFALAAILSFTASPALSEGDKDAEADGAPASGEASEDFSIGFGIDLISSERRGGETRTRLLDVTLVRLLDVESRDPDYSRLELLHVPLVTVYTRERDGDKSSVRLLDVPFFTLFRSDRQGDEQLDTRFFELPIVGSLYAHEKTADRERRQVLFLIRLESVTGRTPQPASP